MAPDLSPKLNYYQTGPNLDCFHVWTQRFNVYMHLEYLRTMTQRFGKNSFSTAFPNMFFFFFKGNQNSKYTVLIISYKKALIGKIDFFFFHCWKQEKRLSRILLNSASMPRWSGWPPNSPKEIKHVKRPPSTGWSLLLRSYKPAYRTWRATCSKATRTFDSENPDWLSPIRQLRISLVMGGIEKKKRENLENLGQNSVFSSCHFFPKYDDF